MQPIKCLLWVALCAMFSDLAKGIFFDVDERQATCLLYSIDGFADLPQIEIKYISNISGTSRSELASKLRITTLDGHRNEIFSNLVNPQSKGLATWTVLKPFGANLLDTFGQSGDFSVCFVREKGLSREIGQPEHTYVGLLMADQKVKMHLEKLSTATRGSSYKIPTIQEAPLSEDEVEEYTEWISDLETQIEEINLNFERFNVRHKEFLVTSNSLFTRIWIMALLTMGVMAVTVSYMYMGLSKMLLEKKLV